MKMPKDLDDWKRWIKFVVDVFKIKVLEKPTIDSISYYSVLVQTYDVISWKGSSGSSPVRCFTLSEADTVKRVLEDCDYERNSKDFKVEIREGCIWLNPYSAVFEKI